MDDTAVGGHLSQTRRQTQTLRGAMSRPGTPVRQPMVSRPPSSRCRGRGGAPRILHSIITHKGRKGKVVPRVTEMCAPKQCRLQGRARTAETSLPGCGSSRMMVKGVRTAHLPLPLVKDHGRTPSMGSEGTGLVAINHRPRDQLLKLMYRSLNPMWIAQCVHVSFRDMCSCLFDHPSMTGGAMCAFVAPVPGTRHRPKRAS